MTEIKPGTDAEIEEYIEQRDEARARGEFTGFAFASFVDQLLARVRQEQRRAEAAERVVDVVRLFLAGGYDDLTEALSALSATTIAFDAAKAAGFPEGKR